MNKKIDLYRISILSLLIIIIFILFQNSKILKDNAKNGRYQYDRGIIIDTQDGTPYIINDNDIENAKSFDKVKSE